jgi:NADP-dependent 3-hydroxy acid dehydrogenase YdfG
MSQIDYTGPMGGALALAFGAGSGFGATVTTAVGAFIWKFFITPRQKELEAEIKDLRAQLDRMQAVWLACAPTPMRAALERATANANGETA